MRYILEFFIICTLIFTLIIPTITTLINTNNLESRRVKVFNITTQQMMNLDLEDYLKGVLAAEMPASFPLSALKSQAVAARTYTLKHLEQGEQLTTDSTKDQAWVSKQKLLHKWGLIGYLQYWAKISAAVEETQGIVLTYQGEFIDAVYHSTSGGETASAKEVWGRTIPYLQSVESSYETRSPYYKVKTSLSAVQLEQKLNLADVDLNQIKVVKRSQSNRILQLKVGKKLFSGPDLRRSLDLPSTRLKLNKRKGEVEFITFGYGHGVGLSQYGASGMAKQGYNFREILAHYYTGIEFSLVKYN
ncbi:stage II sporulation protein D [Halanaerocella petrolearia]